MNIKVIHDQSDRYKTYCLIFEFLNIFRNLPIFWLSNTLIGCSFFFIFQNTTGTRLIYLASKAPSILFPNYMMYSKSNHILEERKKLARTSRAVMILILSFHKISVKIPLKRRSQREGGVKESAYLP